MSGLNIEATIDHDEKSNITNLALTFIMPDYSYSEKDITVITRAVKSCPVSKLLSDTVQKEMTFKWPDT